jgi:hypothetical protein
MDCVDATLLAPGTIHPATNLVFSNAQPEQCPPIQDVQDFSNGGFGSDAVGLASDRTSVTGRFQGKPLRGTERAKLACVACRRDNKKVNLRALESD